jgi:hypothetical protein
MIRRHRWLFVFLLGLGFLAAASELVIPALIGEVHRGSGVAALDGMLAGRDVHPAAHYVARWHALSRPAVSILAGLWVMAAFLSRPAVTRRLASRLAVSGDANAAAPVLPSPGRRRLVAALAGAITTGSLVELALDPPYRGEHWPFSQYQMYSDIPKKSFMARRLYGVVWGSPDREIPLRDKAYIRPFDHSRLWFSWDRLDKSPDRQRLLPIALRDCLERYEVRRVRGLHEGPRFAAVRLYALRWTSGASARESPPRELIWEVHASSPSSPSPSP